jgi:hypothetical protein
MTTPTDAFFDRLASYGHDPLLAHVHATVRFDVTDEGGRTEHRLVTFDHGDIRVTADDGPADCAVSGDRAVFDAVLGGRTGAMRALLRGALEVDGDPELLVLTQRILPAPSTRTVPGGVAGSGAG